MLLSRLQLNLNYFIANLGFGDDRLERRGTKERTKAQSANRLHELHVPNLFSGTSKVYISCGMILAFDFRLVGPIYTSNEAELVDLEGCYLWSSPVKTDNRGDCWDSSCPATHGLCILLPVTASRLYV